MYIADKIYYQMLQCTKSSYPQKYSFFLKPPKILKSKIRSQKNDPSLRMYENIRVPSPPPPPWDFDLETFWRKGRTDSTLLWGVYFIISEFNKNPRISELASLGKSDSISEEKISIRPFIFRSKLVSMANY